MNKTAQKLVDKCDEIIAEKQEKHTQIETHKHYCVKCRTEWISEVQDWCPFCGNYTKPHPENLKIDPNKKDIVLTDQEGPTGVRHKKDGMFSVIALNEGGYNSTSVDIEEIIKWTLENKPSIITNLMTRDPNRKEEE